MPRLLFAVLFSGLGCTQTANNTSPGRLDPAKDLETVAVGLGHGE